MKIYLVGGAVRDRLLDLVVNERDWVVVGSTPDEMLDAGFRRADSEFPVFLHPETGEEYALARTEVKTATGYKGFQVEYGPHITLEQDLLRRDLTINAMAMTERGDLIDICGGRDDLDSGLLRHITDAFAEDPVRLLRIARFAAKLGCWGFRVAHGTHALMKKMALSDDLMSLNAERIWREMKGAFSTPQPWRFFEVLHRCGALQRLLPELAEGMVAGGHEEETRDEFTAPLKRVANESEDPVVRCGVALFDTVSRLAQPDQWMRQLRIEKADRRLLHDLLRFHRLSQEPEQAEKILRFVATLNPKRQPVRFHRFVAASQGLWPQCVENLLPKLEYSAELLGSPIPEELVRSGLEGQALGEALFAWRVVRLEEVMRRTRGSN
ncbi:MAG: multifunctional CCA tRNA nucleotidyl transferase/2'3'-cyclic phosphodiesterase/2'nucleotidase/phosphatase [Candidatus Thiodiazotropha sp.]